MILAYHVSAYSPARATASDMRIFNNRGELEDVSLDEAIHSCRRGVWIQVCEFELDDECNLVLL